MFDSLIHKTLKGEMHSEIPFWFMRQAGRYLPEYKKVRQQAGGFLNLCYNPENASEVTLQPVKRFDVSAAIIFSDILVIPHAMGMDVRFEEGEGPKLSPIRDYAQAERLHTNIEAHVRPVSEAIQLTRSKLSKDKSLIGFCGAPWTVACYMVEGQGSKNYELVRNFARKDKKTFSLIIDKIIQASVLYLSIQVKSGADIIQIFDSWAGVLSEDEFETWVIKPTQTLVNQFKKLHPDIPVIGFPRGSGVKYKTYAEQVNTDAISIDVETPLSWARDNLQKPLQGNLDPILLQNDKQGSVEATKQILETMHERPFIFNLGHGILQHTPIENVEAVFEVIKSAER